MFAITLGSAFFVIPGIALGVLLGLVVPAYVVDGAGLTGAFSRSIALSENNRLRLLGYLSAANLALMAVTLVAAFALAALGNGMMSALGSGGRSMALLLSILAFAAYLLMFAVFGLAALAAGVIPASAWAEFVTYPRRGPQAGRHRQPVRLTPTPPGTLPARSSARPCAGACTCWR
jgi:hypothetical protein